MKNLARCVTVTLALSVGGTAVIGSALAQEKPRYGGELLFPVPSEPPSYDAHREQTFGVIHPLAPHYNGLLQVDPTDPSGTKPAPDLAESWTMSKDGLVYTFRLRKGVKFHDGSEMTSKDVKASYDRIIFPPPGIVSDRKGQYEVVEVVEAPDPYTSRFRLKWPAASFLASVASPWNWIYKAALVDKITVQESPWDCVLLVAPNHQKKPFDDKRVRRALTLALDRYEGSKALSKIAIVKEVAGVQVPGTPYATPPEELAKLAGYGKDINASRAEAKKLLKEAGAEGLSFTFKNRGVPMPYEPVAVWLIDQWRQIGVTVKPEVIEAAAYYDTPKRGDFQVAMDFQCGYIVQPDLDLYKLPSLSRNPSNYSFYDDKVLDDLYQKQSRALDAEERKKYVRDFEKRLLDDEAHYLITLQWHRIIPHSSKVHGWQITPSHYLNNQLDTVWRSQRR